MVSGGSAWADHVAVKLFLEGEFAKLELHLPAKFDCSQNKFESNQSGSRLNSLHQIFSDKTQSDTLNELSRAISDPLTQTSIHDGFHNRNTLVANQCDYLIAFTFNGTNSVPKEGGTKDTWDKCPHSNKMHLSLESV